METLRTKANRMMHVFGVTVDETHLALTLLANIEAAAKTECW